MNISVEDNTISSQWKGITYRLHMIIHVAYKIACIAYHLTKSGKSVIVIIT